jgi:glycosyltransferase involved in cell wall biosynthesis
LLDAETPEAIASGIEKLLDADLRAALGANGRNAFRERFNAEAAQNSLREIYQEMFHPAAAKRVVNY